MRDSWITLLRKLKKSESASHVQRMKYSKQSPPSKKLLRTQRKYRRQPSSTYQFQVFQSQVCSTKCAVLTNKLTGPSVIQPEEERSFQLAASIATMCNCIGQDWEDPHYGDSALGSIGRWQCDEPLHSFISDAFPKEEHKDLQLGGAKGETIRRKLTAVNLKSIGNIEIQGTHDLRNHLRLSDWEGKVRVKIFHHTSFLRQHLLASKQAKEQG